MYNLVLLLMGIVFIYFKNNKKILLKNIFIQKDVDLNSKKLYGIITFPFECKAICSSLANVHSFFSSEPRTRSGGEGSSWTSAWRPCTREGVAHTHLVWFYAVWYLGQPAHFENKAQVLLAVPSGPGLAALDLAWRILPTLKGTAFTNSNQILQ